jgi:hypothetical protein
MRRFLPVLAGLLLSGCTMLSGTIAGQLENGSESFTGSIAQTSSGGTLTLKTSTGATCNGSFETFTSPNGGDAVANGLMKCSDGRSGSFHVIATVSNTMIGTGDLGGQRITFSAE